MGHKKIVFCDLTKLEVSADTPLVSITIKIPGKKTGRTYELSPESAAKLEQQLVSDNKLATDWQFANSKIIDTSLQTRPPFSASKRTLADLDTDENDSIAAKAHLEHIEEEAIEETPEEPVDLGLAVDNSGCLHANKGPVSVGMKNGKRFIYKQCKKCRRRIPERSKKERDAFITATPPEDSREDYHGK